MQCSGSKVAGGCSQGEAALVKPMWLRRKPGSDRAAHEVKKLLRLSALNTVCEEGRCPNIAECFSRKTATFMILGDICTRGCRFCSVITGRPKLEPKDFSAEGERVAEAAAALKLRYVVVTSVARDDLEDGGASGFVATIGAIRKRLPAVQIEVLIPDFRGRKQSLESVVEAAPDVLNHNLETVPRLYRRVRPGAGYQRSLSLLRSAKAIAEERGLSLSVKSGIMVGLGETEPEVVQLFSDARSHGVDIITAGQYLQPTREHLPVVEFISEERFRAYEQSARQIGFSGVFIGPLVRSSYHAGEVHAAAVEQIKAAP